MENLRPLPPSMTMPIPLVIITRVSNISIVGSTVHNIARSIKKATYTRINDPSLNSNIGKFQLPHIWDEVFFNNPDLNLK